jgi:hypothetical protein
MDLSLQHLLRYADEGEDMINGIVSPLKKHLGGKCFADDEAVEMEVRKGLRQQSKNTSMLRVSNHW